MIDISGLTGAAPLWSSYMQAVYSNADLVSRLAVNGQQPPSDFVRPPGVSEKPLCALASATVGSIECAPAGSELFLDTPPTQPTPAPEQPLVVWEELDPAVWRIPAIPLQPTTLDPVAAALVTPGRTGRPAAAADLLRIPRRRAERLSAAGNRAASVPGAAAQQREPEGGA